MPNIQNYQSINGDIENQELLISNNDNNLENQAQTTTLWNISKKILNIGDFFIACLITISGKIALGGTWNYNGNLALPEAIFLINGGVFNDINKINEKLYYQSKKELIADFILRISSLPIPLIIMLNRYPLPWGPVDEKWLDNNKNSIFLGYPPLDMGFNNITIETFLCLSATAISKIIILFLKSLNTWKHTNNSENLPLINNNQNYEKNNLEKIINIIKKIDFFTELVAMINISIFPPTFSERFGWTFETIFDNPFWIRLGAGINIITSTINEFNIYNKIKSFFVTREPSEEIITTNNNENFEDNIENINNDLHNQLSINSDYIATPNSSQM